MKAKSIKFTTCLLAVFMILGISSSMASSPSIWKTNKKQEKIDTLKYNVYRGKIVDNETKDPLVFATIAVEGTNVATVSNSDGEFLLKIEKTIKAEKVNITHIGYKNLTVDINSLQGKKNLLRMETATIPIKEVSVYPHDPVQLIKNMLKKVPENYSTDPNMMKGFYRETIKKNRSYVSISEAVVNIHKASYSQMRDDQVQIYKGRKSQDVKKMDTLMFKLQGGPTTSLLLDVIKNPYSLLSEDFIENYDYKLMSITKINDKLHYVIEFNQRPDVDFPLYYGLLYIDCDNLALSSAKFNLNLENIEEAAKLFIRKKPAGVKVTPTNATYLVNYRQQNGKWFFNYARGEVKFKCNWKRKLFNTNYSTMTEIAITDRSTQDVVRFKPREKFKANEVLVDEVQNFADPNYWGAYNTIEPDQSIESAIRKLKRKANQ